MSNAVPDGWSIKSLNGHMEILSGFPFKSSLFCDDSSQIGMIRIRDLLKQNIETFYAGDFDEEYIVERGDILIGMDGDFNIVKWKAKDALLNQRICKIKAFPNKGFDTDFLFHSLVEDLDSIHAATGATTVKHLSVKDIRGIEKAYPPLPEQQKIAAILSSVDDVIEKTRAQIDKLKDLKTGMMQALLTKGIGHTAFKDSPVGRIPEGWEITTLGSIVVARGLQTGPFGSQLHAHEYIERGVPVVMPKDMKRNSVDETTIAHIPEEKAEQLAKHRVRTGDILFARRGDIGRFALIEQKNEGWICGTGCLKARLADSIDPVFISCYLTLTPVIEWLNLNAVGQTMLNLNTSILAELPVILPPQDEQSAIGDAISSLDDRVGACQEKLEALQSVKKALMQDLLTGKVRVNVDNKEHAVA